MHQCKLFAVSSLQLQLAIKAVAMFIFLFVLSLFSIQCLFQRMAIRSAGRSISALQKHIPGLRVRSAVISFSPKLLSRLDFSVSAMLCTHARLHASMCPSREVGCLKSRSWAPLIYCIRSNPSQSNVVRLYLGSYRSSPSER